MSVARKLDHSSRRDLALPSALGRHWVPAFAGTRSGADERGFTSLRRSAENGFTLLEMLVALAVFSLAALALIRLQAVSLRTAADLDERQVARIVAHNLMVEAQTEAGPLAMGESDGALENGGRQWRWTQKVGATDVADIVRVDVRVSAADGEGSPSVLTFLRAQQ